MRQSLTKFRPRCGSFIQNVHEVDFLFAKLLKDKRATRVWRDTLDILFYVQDKKYLQIHVCEF